MARFTVKAKDPSGKQAAFPVDGNSQAEVISKLRAKGYQVISVSAEAADGNQQKEKPPSTAAPVPAPVAKHGRKLYIGRISHKELTRFTHQFAVLLDAGLTVARALKILRDQQKPGLLKDCLTDVVEDVEGGSKLSESFQKHPKVFDKLYVHMVYAGEKAGILDEVLQRLAEYLEKIEAIKRKVIGAMIYPAVVMTVAVLVVLGIMTFIVPKFQDVFKSANVELPTPTMFLMGVSNFIKAFWWLILGSPLIMWMLFKIWGRTKGGRMAIDRLKMKMPVLGPIFQKSATARFCRTFGTLLKSGVNVLEALDICKNAAGNEVLAVAVQEVRDNVKEGETIARPLQKSGVFDDVVINMIEVGEETGELQEMLLKVAEIYDAEVDAAVTAMVSLIEPALILGLGGIVGFIVISLFLPLISLIQGLSSSGKKG